MAHNRSVGAALLAWVCDHIDATFEPISNFSLQVRTFPLESKVESFADLSDGFVLSKVLGTCSSRSSSLSLSLLCLRMLTSTYCRGFRPSLCRKRPRAKCQSLKMDQQQEVVRSRIQVLASFHQQKMSGARISYTRY